MSKASSEDDLNFDLAERATELLNNAKGDKQTRFQVNRVKNEDDAVELRIKVHRHDSEDDDYISANDRTRLNSDYVKSFR